jgi:hypothetical protein
MTLVPIITLLFGYFPIALNFWTVVAISIYYVSLHALTYYCRSMREFRALWLANIGTSIMFWPYFKAALFTPFKQLAGKGMTFKSTSKGGRRSSVSLKEIGPSLLLTMASLFAFICGLTDFNVNVNAPKAIALCWVLYNIVPHVLLLVYSRFGSGNILRYACNALMVTQSIISVLALILLWILYPREEDYVRATDLSLSFLYSQRSGALVQPYPISWRFNSGTENKIALRVNMSDPAGFNLTGIVNITADLTGGYYTDGEVGPVKITVHVAMTTAMLAWSLLDYREWWLQNDVRYKSALELVRHGQQYVNECYLTSSTNATGNDVIVYLVRSLYLLSFVKLSTLLYFLEQCMLVMAFSSTSVYPIKLLNACKKISRCHF